MALLTVVTAVLNRADFIGQAIQSLLDQSISAGEVEHIIMDGGSTDGTLEILAGYHSLTIVSEPDHGVYDAMNKGIRMARGEFIGLLNSDDRYPPGALAQVLEAINDDVDMVGGDALVVDATRPDRPVLERYGVSDPALRLFDLTRGVPRTNAWFIRRSVFDDIGFFDGSLRVAADREWLLRAWKANMCATAVSVPVYEYGSHEGSLTISGNSGEVLREENLEICRRFLDQRDTSGALRRELRTWRAQLLAGGWRDDIRARGLGAMVRPAIAPTWRDIPWLARAGVQRWFRSF